MIRPEELFYSKSSILDWEIEENQVRVIKKLKVQYREGAYCPKIITIRQADNSDIIDEYRGDVSSSDFFNLICINLQFFTKHINIENLTDDFIKENNIKNYHLLLINRIYFDEDPDYVEPDQINSGMVINNGDKRPFGNSHIVGDILEVVNYKIYSKEWDDNDIYNGESIQNMCWRIYNEVVTIIPKIMHIFPMSFRNFEKIPVYGVGSRKWTNDQIKYSNGSWFPSISEFREKKINEILDINLDI